MWTVAGIVLFFAVLGALAWLFEEPEPPDPREWGDDSPLNSEVLGDSPDAPVPDAGMDSPCKAGGLQSEVRHYSGFRSG
jgi:hypothetical protein